MTQRYFVFDPSLCIGCFGCVAACVSENHLQGSQQWRKVMKVPPHDRSHDTHYMSVSCNHCENAPCVEACPTEAMHRRDTDGIVLHEKDKCMGCRYCQMACPYGAIIWMEDSRTVGKCNMCYERIDRGKNPACVETCFGKALSICSIDEGKESIDGPEDIKKETIGFDYRSEVKPRLRFTFHHRLKTDIS